MLTVSWFLCGVLCFLLYNYLFCKLVCKDVFKFNRKTLLLSIIIGCIYYILSKFGYFYFRPYIIHIYILFSLQFIYKKNLTKTILGLFSIFILVLISEMIYGLFAIYVFKIDLFSLNKNVLFYTLSNIIIFIFVLFLSNIKIIKKIFNNIVIWYNENELKSLILLVGLVLTIAIFVLYNNFTRLLPKSLLLFTNLFFIGIFVFIIGFFKEKAQNDRMSNEYDQLLKYVKVYEDEIEQKSKNQHEYKNQLVLIRGLINSKNKKAINYIDNLLNTRDNSNVDMNWLNKLKNVPQGGLKGLIYYKLQEMIKNKVKIFVDISPQLSKIDNKKFNSNLEDISKVIGVYLDNAIESVKNMDEKMIVIEFYLEDTYIVFSLSNTYNGIIDMKKIDNEGYTTKGVGKGYGLSLVKDILSKNNNLSQKREMNGIYFVQKLYIKR